MTNLPAADIRKTAAKLVPGDVVHVLPVSQTDNHLLNWLGKRDDIEMKTVATVDKDASDPRNLVITYTDGTKTWEARNTKARLVSEVITPAPADAAAPVADDDAVPVNLPVRLFAHLRTEGYADDQISERRRTLYAELAAAPQCNIRNVINVTAMLSDLSAHTLFDALLDLWELRRRGASDLRRPALRVLADLQAAGVRKTENIPASTAANPVMDGTDTLRSLLRF